MSKKEKDTEQKVVTKYDRKMQKRKEQKEREAKEALRAKIITTLVIVLVVGFFAYFPIKDYLAYSKTFITIDGENISKLEFDYNYNYVKNNYISQNGTSMAYFGIDLTGDLTTQMYSETMTWQDYFEQMAVENIVQNRALEAQAQAAGFTYDTSKEYKDFKNALNEVAAQIGVGRDDYLQSLYGTYATLGRISGYVKEDLKLNAYLEQVAEEKTPPIEEVKAYYESSKDNYDSVDYRMTKISAQLPTETTPTEEEISKAMADALAEAKEAEKKVKTEGELQENVTKAYVVSTITSWLFDSTRKAGDTTIIEDPANNQYYVLAFEKRYLDETPSVDVRVLLTEDMNGQELLDKWKAGKATEDSFAELCEKNSVDVTAIDGGMYEAVTKTGMPEELSAWLFDTARVAGDTTVIDSEDGSYQFVMYYVGTNSPEWQLSIEEMLLTTILEGYLKDITANIQVSDPEGNLNYLKLEATESDATEAEGTEEAAEDSELATEATADSSESAAEAATDSSESATETTTDSSEPDVQSSAAAN